MTNAYQAPPHGSYVGGGRTSGGGAASISANNLVISQVDFAEAVADFHVEGAIYDCFVSAAAVSDNHTHLVRSAANDDTFQTADVRLALLHGVQTVDIVVAGLTSVLAVGRGEIAYSVFDCQNFVLHFCTLTFFFRGAFPAPVVFTNSVFVGDIRVQLFT